MNWPATQVDLKPISFLQANPRNSRKHPRDQIEALAKSLLQYGWARPVLAQEDGIMIAGHGCLEAAALLVERGHTDFEQVPVMTAQGWSQDQVRAYVIADNRLAEQSVWDFEALQGELTYLTDVGLDVFDMTGWASQSLFELTPSDNSVLSNTNAQADAKTTLAQAFGIPPFSVLNAREGWWQDRKRAWIALGIQSELGRGGGMTLGLAPQVTEPGLNYYRRKALAQ